MRELEQIREQLNLSYDYKLKAEDAVLAQRRRAKELASIFDEERASNDALPHSMKG